MAALDREAVAAVDSTGQAADILALPDHLLDALWRVEAAALQPAGTAGGLVVAGMGGSGVGGALARALLAPQLARPLELVARLERPGLDAGPDTLVLCSSYSGNTEETLAAYDAAGAAGAPRVVSASGGELAARARRDKVPVIPLPGGFQPRAAVGYSFVVALEVAARGRLRAVAARGDRGGGAVRARARGRVGPRRAGGRRREAPRARAARDACRSISGPGLAAAAAYRWKCQLNENAKVPAFAAELPEAGHNEIVGWEDAATFAALLGRVPRGPRRGRAAGGAQSS